MATVTPMYINGEWVQAENGGTLPVVNPATEEVIGQMAYGTRADVRRALEAARDALPGWMKLTAYDRARFLKKAGDLMRERADALARALTTEQGKPLAEAKGEILHSADTLEWFAEQGKRAYGQLIPNSVPGKRHLTLKHPVGVVAAISPWNFPVTLQIRKMAPALAAGCTVVGKPSPETPLVMVEAFKCLVDAGLPKGVANLVLTRNEDFGDEIIENPIVRKISFTGSTPVGKMIMRRAADQVKRVSLEMGGHAPFIVLPDADPEAVAKAAVIGKFRNNGQVCIAPSRFFVHKDIQKKFTEVVVETARALKMGNGLEPGVEVGPMIGPKGLEKTASLVQEAVGRGATVMTGGGRSKRFERGYFYEPTVLTGLHPQSQLLTEEPFAPVMPLMDYDKLDDVIKVANSTRYGLAAYVFTNDVTAMFKLAEGLEAGIIGVNDPVPATPQCPFGGMKESGYGRELAAEGLDAYLETKYVSLKLRD
jgi:succinate-semialdehyde dehydrogenase/glutarate-semialdehyde dehydrogenase